MENNFGEVTCYALRAVCALGELVFLDPFEGYFFGGILLSKQC